MKPYYQDEYCTIYHGDCRDILPTLDPVDLVLTDPPYGLNSWSSTGGHSLKAEEVALISKWDSSRPSVDTIRICISKGKTWIVWGANYFADILGACKTPLFWDKDVPNGMHFADGELAFTNFKNGSLSVFRLPVSRADYKGSRLHPTQKPVSLMKWCIQKTDHLLKCQQQTVLDPFMGSGTTLRASKDLNRKAIGIELEEKYCEIAVKRLSQEVFNFKKEVA